MPSGLAKPLRPGRGSPLSVPVSLTFALLHEPIPGIAPVRTGQPHRHTERQAFVVHAGAAGEKERQPKTKQRRGAGREKQETQPRRENAAGLHLTELERVRKSLRGGAHVAVQAFALLSFVVFQTSDMSYHEFEPQQSCCASEGSSLASYSGSSSASATTMSGGDSMGEDAWAELSGEDSVFVDSAGGTKISVSQP